MRFIRKNALPLIGGAVGAVGGYLYYRFVGCAGGTCPITSSPVWSTVWGAAMGGLLLSMFKQEKKTA